ncbi:MAG: nicotinate (nicotinamide) nucleotide adenylyltransferase [Clostridia bacterium]|nr:nicotinate (nicotinamide) nucleotide adenylyltransferase [Clostridia bacterium]
MKTKLGIYGGTYAPVHNGHIRAAIEFKDQFELDRLLIIPTSVSPHKAMPAGDSALHRYNMLKLAFEGYERIEVSDYELNKEGKSYTVETLRHFSSPATELYFLCGTDMLLSMHTWYKADEIATLATLVYTRRETDTSLDSRIEQQISFLRSELGFKIKEMIMEPLELSSTVVRKAKDRSSYLPPAVDRYIKENNLYVQ